MNLFTSALLLLFCAFTVHAQDTQTTQGYVAADRTNAVPIGFVPYLGMGAGYTQYNPELDVEGVPSSAKLLGSYYTLNERGVYDLGVGVQGQSFSQDSASDKTISAGLLEAAARYQTEDRWQFGVVYNQFFDKGQNFGANQADAEFAGLQVVKEFGFGDKYLARIGGRVMTDLNVNDEMVNMTMIDIQIGWDAFTRGSSSLANRADENTSIY